MKETLYTIIRPPLTKVCSTFKLQTGNLTLLHTFYQNFAQIICKGSTIL
jgi:hypothetical protein